MAGGSGTRFWPKSSRNFPKQLLSLTDHRSLLQMTADRLKKIVSQENLFVVGTERLKNAIKTQLPLVNIFAEPEGRNTMAAVCWSTWKISEKNPEAVISVLPADAYIENIKSYQESLQTAFEIAKEDDRIVCLGIKPRYASTAYGYIEAGDEKITGGAKNISRFIEKPDSKKAKEIFNKGHFLWNAGIFVFKAKVFKAEVLKHAPKFAEYFDKMPKSKNKFKTFYKSLPKAPVDTALMEKTSRGAVISGDFGWNDLGSWPALEEVFKNNESAGLIRGAAACLSIDSKGMIVDLEHKKLIAFIGVENLIVVETEKSLLIATKDRAQEIKKIVELIEQNKKLKDRFL
jgi:mannose-1-phosphate guanylyltransferase